VAFELKVLRSSADRIASDESLTGCRETDLSKRKRLLRGVASECGESPKDVLSEVYRKLRRTASTTSSRRMSERFARTSHRDADTASASTASDDWAWQAIGNVVHDVLKSRSVPPRTSSPSKVQ
jgi:hypothetical protein